MRCIAQRGLEATALRGLVWAPDMEEQAPSVS